MSQVTEFGNILLFIIGGIVFVCGGLFTAFLIRPSRPNDQKLTSYECGEDTVGSAWGNFNIRFYIIAIIFLLFEVEIIFLFPWATVFGNAALIAETNGLWGWFALTEATIFILILALGLAYAWKHGYLNWVVPTPKETTFKSPIPSQLYEELNRK
ncbi:MAG: NADH-quinone oxidoreductase subunit A [Cyclobacteriaceae bacterium]